MASKSLSPSFDLDAISQQTGSVTKLAIALNGEWETAISPQSTVNYDFIRNHIEGHSDVAFVIFFASEATGTSFLGVRLNNRTNDEQARIIINCLEHVGSKKWSTLNETVTGLRLLIDPNLFQSSPDFLEVGVVDLWRSVGPVIIWEKGEPLPTENSIRERLDTHPVIYELHSNVLSMDTAFSSPIPHWFARQVSVEKSGKHQLDMDRLFKASQ